MQRESDILLDTANTIFWIPGLRSRANANSSGADCTRMCICPSGDLSNMESLREEQSLCIFLDFSFMQAPSANPRFLYYVVGQQKELDVSIVNGIKQQPRIEPRQSKTQRKQTSRHSI